MVVTKTRHEDASQQLRARGIRLQLQVVLDPGGGEASGESTVDEGYRRGLGGSFRIEPGRASQEWLTAWAIFH